MTRYNSIELARKVTHLHLKAMERVSAIPCSDCETPDECTAEGECAIANGDDE